jgi:hypothetical protein
VTIPPRGHRSAVARSGRAPDSVRLGDARVGIGRGTKIFVDAASVSGSLNSELSVGDETPTGESGESGSTEVVPVHVKTVSGDVRLVRAS